MRLRKPGMWPFLLRPKILRTILFWVTCNGLSEVEHVAGQTVGPYIRCAYSNVKYICCKDFESNVLRNWWISPHSLLSLDTTVFLCFHQFNWKSVWMPRNLVCIALLIGTFAVVTWSRAGGISLSPGVWQQTSPAKSGKFRKHPLTFS